jgi:quercetin dioxygenase-like cupin family protein
VKYLAKFVAAAVISTLSVMAATTAFATEGNEMPTPVAKGTLTGGINGATNVAGGRVRVKANGALDVFVVQVTIPPGGNSGWHSHAGPHFTVVNSGTLTTIRAKGCKTETLQAGQATYDARPSDTLIVVNRGS